jgi:hypothetical protein
MDRAVDRAQELMGEASDKGWAVAKEAWTATRLYLATDEGRRLRKGVAAALIVGAPIVSELPVLRRTMLGRALRVAGVGALMVKGAEWLRDWEPGPAG